MSSNAPARLSLLMSAVTSVHLAPRFADSIEFLVGRIGRRLWGLAFAALAVCLAPFAKAHSEYVTPHFFATLTGTARDAVLLVTLQPGSYTAQISASATTPTWLWSKSTKCPRRGL